MSMIYYGDTSSPRPFVVSGEDRSVGSAEAK